MSARVEQLSKQMHRRVMDNRFQANVLSAGHRSAEAPILDGPEDSRIPSNVLLAEKKLIPVNGRISVYDFKLTFALTLVSDLKHLAALNAKQFVYRRYSDRLEIVKQDGHVDEIVDVVGINSEGVLINPISKRPIVIRKMGGDLQEVNINSEEHHKYNLADLFFETGAVVISIKPAIGSHPAKFFYQGKQFCFSRDSYSLSAKTVGQGQIVVEANRNGVFFYRAEKHEFLGAISFREDGALLSKGKPFLKDGKLLNIISKEKWIVLIEKFIPEFAVKDYPISILYNAGRKDFVAVIRYKGLIFGFPADKRVKLYPKIRDGEVYLRIGEPGVVTVICKTKSGEVTNIGSFRFDEKSGQVFDSQGNPAVFAGNPTIFDQTRVNPPRVAITHLIPEIGMVEAPIGFHKTSGSSLAYFFIDRVRYGFPCDSDNLYYAALKEGRVFYRYCVDRGSIFVKDNDGEKPIGSFKVEPRKIGQKNPRVNLEDKIPEVHTKRNQVKISERGLFRFQQDHNCFYLFQLSDRYFNASTISTGQLFLEICNGELRLIYMAPGYGEIYLERSRQKSAFDKFLSLRKVFPILSLKLEGVSAQIAGTAVEADRCLFKGEFRQALPLIERALYLSRAGAEDSVRIKLFAQIIRDPANQQLWNNFMAYRPTERKYREETLETKARLGRTHQQIIVGMEFRLGYDQIPLLLAIIQNPDEESEIKSAAIKRLGDIAKKIKSLSEENMPDSEKEIYIRQLLSQISGLMGNKKLAGHMRELFQAYQAIG